MDLFDLPDDSELPDAPVMDAQKLQDAITVYREAWREFYTWEAIECTRTIKECERPTTVYEIEREREEEEIHFDAYPQEFDPEPLVDPHVESFTVEEFDGYGESVRYATLICPDVDREEIRPYSRYEACTPASYNYAKETHHGDALDFIPYADDEAFPIEEYLRSFELFSWQTDFPDPDCEMIQLEVATRLITVNSSILEEGFTIPEVDQLNILRKLRIHRSSGLLWDTAQRDGLWWSSLPGDPTISRDFVPKTRDVFEHVNQEIPNFCPKLKCLRSFCATHKNPYGGLDIVKPKLRSDELEVAGRGGCGDTCFRYVYGEDYPTGLVKWEDPEDVVEVESILKLLPDESPCNLAVICRKRCFEIFAFRCSRFNDADIEDGRVPERPPHALKPIFVDDYFENDANSGKFTVPPPCHHPGPCDQFTCSCHQNNQHCQRSCRCDRKCAIRWKGCDCKHSKKSRGGDRPCQSADKCKCLRAGRECDPELCVRCGARGKGKAKGNCRNVNLQRGEFPTIMVRYGSYGLGAFATSQISENTTIGEYFGEIIRDIEHGSYAIIHAHTGLNYIFDLDSIYSLDAAKLGNEMRYLNDYRDRPDYNNCVAQLRLIDGDHRIALVTNQSVQPNEELFLSYGENYWNLPASEDMAESPLPEDY
ncbi:hypothetical protein FPV67DRAFT_1492038 [Lyophyllum atratum]|nr:hypothetical protein FPV67DRAFT_1492038 [Lyophyllum atratum]